MLQEREERDLDPSDRPLSEINPLLCDDLEDQMLAKCFSLTEVYFLIRVLMAVKENSTDS